MQSLLSSVFRIGMMSGPRDLGRSLQRATPNRSRRGLYGGKQKGFGNQVSEYENKTRRCWNPNVTYKRLYSEILGRKIRCRVTMYCLRWIDKVGGFDNYILKVPPHKQKSDFAAKWRDILNKKLQGKKDWEKGVQQSWNQRMGTHQ